MAVQTDDENEQPPESCSPAGHEPPHHVAARRIIAMASSMKTSIEIGSALPLLQHIVLKCGGRDDCLILLTDLASACGAPHPTLRSWLKKLADAGLIEKTAAGCEGLRISLSDSLLRQINPSSMDRPLAGLVQKAAATQVVVSSMFEQLIADLKRGGIAG